MKFTDGYWLKREGYNIVHPAHAYETRDSEGMLSVLAPVKKINERSDVLNLPAMNLYFTSPQEDVISVKIEHFKGALKKGPYFEIDKKDVKAVINKTEKETIYTSGKLSAKISHDSPWSVKFFGDGKYLTSSADKSVGYVIDPNEKTFVHEQLTLKVGELVYGMGERFSAFVKNGQVVDIWNKDGGTSSEQTYKNVPFYMTNNGYGVFVNEPGPVSFEVASEKVSRVQMSVPGESLEYMIIYGPTPAEIIKKYTALTGRPSLPPSWSFGLWLTTSFTTSYDAETVMGFINGMEERHLPLHVFHFDCFWMKGFRWCDFKWDCDTFSDIKALIDEIHKKGIKVCFWINPYIAQNGEIFSEALNNGYLLHKPDGSVWQTDLWQAGMGIVDFTNPEATKWYLSKLEPLLDLGVDCFKTDFGERIPVDVVYSDGSDPVKMHNYYSYLYNEAVNGLLKDKKGNPILYARSATAGCQKFPVHWGGDCFSDFESMAESLRGGLSLSLCGFGFWSHDIGGFEGNPDPDVFKRWIAFGLMSSHSRLHGSSSYRVPWLIDEESVDVLRHFTNLKCRLMPYLFRMALLASTDGIPVMRPMMFEFPDDPGCYYLDRQYMIGDSVLVSPVFNKEGLSEFYLPPGRWTELTGTRTIVGPVWIREKYDFMSMPLFVKEGTVLATGSDETLPDYDYRDGVTLELYEIPDGYNKTVSIVNQEADKEILFKINRNGQAISIERIGSIEDCSWSVLTVGKKVEIKNITSESSRGSIISPEGNTLKFDIE
ncbi:MAG: alpha-xylosidase [Spirochaetales bacterium]|nr:alpha-xylosidase [Spirochaetales bacterium]